MTDDFPVGSFKDAAKHLRRPFTAEAVRFKVQSTWPKDNPTNGLVVCYIDARLVVERLNLIVPDRWSDNYEVIGGGLMWCHLTVDGITRSDVGEGQGKALVSDALKRAAVKFGVGVSLYATPKMFIGVDGDQAKQRPTSKGITLELRPRGEAYVRNIYRQWLEQHGAQAFGDPLDHGDVMDAAGDPEETGADSAVAPDVRVASPGQRGMLTAKAGAAQLAPSEFANVILAAAGQDSRDFDSEDQANELVGRLLDRLPAQLVDRVLVEINKTMETAA